MEDGCLTRDEALRDWDHTLERRKGTFLIIRFTSDASRNLSLQLPIYTLPNASKRHLSEI